MEATCTYTRPLRQTMFLPLCSVFRRVFQSYEELETAFVTKALHPGDLKAGLTAVLNEVLEPVRQHFASGEPKKLLEQVKKFRITR